MPFSSFEDFATSTNKWIRNEIIREPGLTIYVRRSVFGTRHIRGEGVDFDLANLSARKPGNGALTRFLDKYEPQYGFYVELIHNPRLAKYLERRGYVIHSEVYGVPSMVKKRHTG